MRGRHLTRGSKYSDMTMKPSGILERKVAEERWSLTRGSYSQRFDILLASDKEAADYSLITIVRFSQICQMKNRKHV